MSGRECVHGAVPVSALSEWIVAYSELAGFKIAPSNTQYRSGIDVGPEIGWCDVRWNHRSGYQRSSRSAARSWDPVQRVLSWDFLRGLQLQAVARGHLSAEEGWPRFPRRGRLTYRGPERVGPPCS